MKLVRLMKLVKILLTFAVAVFLICVYTYIFSNVYSSCIYDISKSWIYQMFEPIVDDETYEDSYVHEGEFKITHYCNCSICCGRWAGGPTASGTIPSVNRTIAVDPDVIPLGTEVLIDGVQYIAEDTGSAIKGTHIDIYCDLHQEALDRGVYTATVRW